MFSVDEKLSNFEKIWSNNLRYECTLNSSYEYKVDEFEAGTKWLRMSDFTRRLVYAMLAVT